MPTTTTNFSKHTTTNPIQKFLIGRFYDRLFSMVKPLKPVSILDVGCGEGFTLARLKRSRIGTVLEGVENSTTAIKLAKKMYPGILIKEASIYELPYEDNSFDLVICTEVLEHLEDPKAALLELKRVSKKCILISVPNEPIFTIANFLRGKYLKNFGNHPEHIQHWSKYSLKKFVRANKLKVSQVKTPFPWTLLLARV